MKLGEMGKISGNAYTALDLNDDEGEDSEEETEKSDFIATEQEKRNSFREFCSSPSILKKKGHVRTTDKLTRKVGVTTPQLKTVSHINSPEEELPKPRARQQHSLFGDPEKGEAVSAQYDVEAVKLDHTR